MAGVGGEFTIKEFVEACKILSKMNFSLKEDLIMGMTNVTEILSESDVVIQTEKLTDAWNKWIEKLEEQGFELTLKVIDKRSNESPHTMPFLIPIKAQKVFFKKDDK